MLFLSLQKQCKIIISVTKPFIHHHACFKITIVKVTKPFTIISTDHLQT